MGVPDLGQSLSLGLEWGRRRAMDQVQAQAQAQEMALQQVAMARRAAMEQAQMAHFAAQDRRLGEQTDIARQALAATEARHASEEKAKAQEAEYSRRHATLAPFSGNDTVGRVSQPVVAPLREELRSVTQGGNPYANLGVPMTDKPGDKYAYTPADLYGMREAAALPGLAQKAEEINKAEKFDWKSVLASTKADAKKTVSPDRVAAEQRRQETADWSKGKDIEKELGPYAQSLPMGQDVDALMARYPNGQIPGLTGVGFISELMGKVTPEAQTNRGVIQRFVGPLRHDLYGANLTSNELKAWKEAQAQGWVTDPEAFRSAMRKFRESQNAALGSSLASFGSSPGAFVKYHDNLPAKHPFRKDKTVQEAYGRYKNSTPKGLIQMGDKLYKPLPNGEFEEVE